MKGKVAVPRVPGSVCINGLLHCLMQWDVCPCTFSFQELVPDRLSFLNILCFTDVGFEAQRGSRRWDFCREVARLVCSTVNAQLKEDSLQPTHTCEEVGRLFRGQSDQVVVKTACLLRLKTSLIISRWYHAFPLDTKNPLITLMVPGDSGSSWGYLFG